MPVNTSDQQLTMPVLGDAADQSVSFSSYNAGSEPRLVHYYADAADRTARNPTPPGGQLSFLTNPGRWDRFVPAPVSDWWECFQLYVNKAAEVQVVNNSTAFVSDSHLVLSLQANARYRLDGLLVWDSGTTGDIKFQWVFSAGAPTMPWWQVFSVDVGVTTGIGNLNALPSSASATPLARAGSGIGTFTSGLLSGIITTTLATTITLQWAQNAAEAVNTRIKQNSWIGATRVG